MEVDSASKSDFVCCFDDKIASINKSRFINAIYPNCWKVAFLAFDLKYNN